MATNREEMNRANLIEDARVLYGHIETETDKVQPTVTSYAIILQARLRYKPNSPTLVLINGEKVHDPVDLLRNIIYREISPSLVVSDRSFTNSDEATEAIKALSRAAVTMGLSTVVSELGLVESLGKQLEDPLADVPEVVPVTRPKVR